LQIDHHQEVGRRLAGDDAQTLHFLGQARHGNATRFCTSTGIGLVPILKVTVIVTLPSPVDWLLI
jgi:hypothetical protein